jgi:hypothetical protein
MSTGRRIALTVGVGVFLGLATLVVEDQGLPTAGVNAAIDLPFGILAAVVFVLAPFVIARWWVVAAMAGPAAALVIMQAAGVQVSLDDGTGVAINYRTIFQFVVLCGVMAILFGLRSMYGTDPATGAGERSPSQSDQPG